MFPIIPQSVHSSKIYISPTVSLENSGSFSSSFQLSRSVGDSVSVVALTDIPSGASTSDISLVDILEKRIILGKDTTFGKKTASLSLSKEGFICEVKDPEDHSWLMNANLANDCHSYNAMVHFGSKPELIKLRLTRTVKKNEPIIIWFSQDVLANLDVPFLTPTNIQGEKQYRCHLCGKTFEYPNPLKIHLTLGCKSIRKQDIWILLKDAINDIESKKARNNNVKSSPVGLVLKSSKTNICRPLNKKQYEEVKVRPNSEPSHHNSAFKPYLNERSSSTNSVQSTVALEQEILHPYFSTLSLFSRGIPIISAHNKVLVRSGETMVGMQDQAGSLIVQQAVDMETFVSNLGKSKQGHLCIYCGKIYSRKYGLKIHIRTHTGFKPLKCKFCMRPFGDPSNLNKHVRLHAEGETPYKCELCGKVLVRRRDLERHMKSRHNTEFLPDTEEISETN